jgi:hypothetical protein
LMKFNTICLKFYEKPKSKKNEDNTFFFDVSIPFGWLSRKD